MFVSDVSDFLFVGKIELYFLSAGEEVNVKGSELDWRHTKENSLETLKNWRIEQSRETTLKYGIRNDSEQVKMTGWKLMLSAEKTTFYGRRQSTV